MIRPRSADVLGLDLADVAHAIAEKIQLPIARRRQAMVMAMWSEEGVLYSPMGRMMVPDVGSPEVNPVVDADLISAMMTMSRMLMQERGCSEAEAKSLLKQAVDSSSFDDVEVWMRST